MFQTYDNLDPKVTTINMSNKAFPYFSSILMFVIIQNSLRVEIFTDNSAFIL